jgi:nitrite reductase (cytochrome c-552)
MPYQRIGAMKISDHHVRSPLLNVNRACQTCHRWSEDELRNRVHTIQDRTFQVRSVAMDALMALIADIKAAKDNGATDASLETPRRHHRRAQFLLDFIEAENSMGFHAAQESVRVLSLSLDETRRGQAALSGGKATPGPRTETKPTPQLVSPGEAPTRGTVRPPR